MSLKSILRNWVIQAISIPRNSVNIEISQLNYGGILKDEKIIVTGGSKGIGLAIAEKLINEGAEIIITGRNENDLKEAVNKLGKQSHYELFDSSNVDGIEDFINNCRKKLGGIDSLVLNAGVSFHEGTFLNVTKDGFQSQFDINLKSNYFFIQTFVKKKLEQNETGNVLVISSETGGKSNDLPYGLTKNALNSFVEGVARRIYQRGIRINAVAPGVTYTNMTRGNHIITDDYSNNSAAGRYLLPSEIAETACFLLSKCSSCITGEILYCDAGSHLKINGFDQDYIL